MSSILRGPSTDSISRPRERTDMTIRNVQSLDDHLLVNLTNFMDSLHKQGQSHPYNLYQELLNGLTRPGIVEALNANTPLAEVRTKMKFITFNGYSPK